MASGKDSVNMSSWQQEIQSHQHNQDIAHKILLAIKGLRYGSVEIIIHDSRIVQIERKEKIRVDTDSSRTT
jgi:hypothetical protein